MMRTRPVPFGMALLAGLGLFAMDVTPRGSTRFDLATVAHAQSHDPVVTSDTPEYCGVLMDRITDITRTTAMPPPTEAAVLSEEGERMCVHGQTRGGILRLRRALAIMRHAED
jgi:hypothetical protein